MKSGKGLRAMIEQTKINDRKRAALRLNAEVKAERALKPVDEVELRRCRFNAGRLNQNDLGTLEDFFVMLEKFDWYCMMNDSYGCAAADYARRDMNQMEFWKKSLTGAYKLMYSQYYEHMFTGDGWSNRGPKHPKPNWKDFGCDCDQEEQGNETSL